MMRDTFGAFGLALLFSWGLSPALVVAQNEEPDADEQDTEAVEPVDTDEAQEADDEEHDAASAKPRRDARAPSGPRQREEPRYLLRQVNKLWDAMEKRLEFSDEQADTIGALFDAFIEELEELAHKRASGEVQETVVDRMRELRTEIDTARKAGDRDAIREIVTELQELRTARQSGAGSGMRRFLAEVSDELDDQQRKSFREIAKRLKLERYLPPKELPLQKLLLAVLSPEVGLSPEHRARVTVIMREAFSVRRPGASAGERLDEGTKEMQSRIFEELTDEQRAKVEEIMQRDDKRGSAYGRDVRRMRRDAPARSGEKDEAEDEGAEDEPDAEDEDEEDEDEDDEPAEEDDEGDDEPERA